MVKIVEDEKNKDSNKIYAFDMDGCIIETKSGATFGKSKDDWKFFRGNMSL